MTTRLPDGAPVRRTDRLARLARPATVTPPDRRTACLALCAAGLVAPLVRPVPGAGPALATVLVAAFVLAAPGLAVLPLLGDLPRSAALVLVPVVGLSVVVLATTAVADAGWWHPDAVLVALAVLTAGVLHATSRRATDAAPSSDQASDPASDPDHAAEAAR